MITVTPDLGEYEKEVVRNMREKRDRVILRLR